MARPQPKPLRSDEEAVSFVSGLIEYAHAKGELDEAMKDGKRTTEELQSEAIEAISKKGATTTLADTPELREWLRTRAKSIESSARNRDRTDGKLMRAYVLVEELVRRGVCRPQAARHLSGALPARPTVASHERCRGRFPATLLPSSPQS